MRQSLLYERFRVRRKVHDALYGPILQCDDLHHDECCVAIKLVYSAQRKQRLQATSNADDPDQERRIIQVLQATPGHPNVVQYLEVCEIKEAQILMFAMEFCGGGDLQQAMTRTPHQRFDEDHALMLFRQIAAGVQFLHTHGIAHRDLSLENVLLTDQGVCKVCDFGLSIRSNQMTSDRVGTRYCMAPEVVAGASYNAMQADIWSLGVILFMMITGSPLFAIAKQGDVTFEILRCHGLGKILQLWRIESMITADTTALLSKMLQVTPSDRLGLPDILHDRVFDWINIAEALTG